LHTRTLSAIVLSLLLTCLAAPKLSVNPISSPDGKAYFREEANRFYVGNDYLEIGFLKDKGSVWSLTDKSSGVDLRKEKNFTSEVWWLVFYTQDKEQLFFGNEDTENFTWSGEETSENSSVLHLNWQNIPNVSGFRYEIQINVTVTVHDDSQTSAWRLSITNDGPYAIERVFFPRISGLKELGESGEDDVFIVPDREGRAFYDPFGNGAEWGGEGPSAWLDMQFMAYYDSYAGFYFATYDDSGYYKRFSWERPSPDWACITIVHYPALSFGGSIQFPYDTVIGVFKGNWYDAAEIYREWAHRQWWCEKKSSEKSSALIAHSDYMITFSRDVEIAFGDRISCDEMVDMIHDACTFYQRPTILQWWGWERIGRVAAPWGDYFPPYEGWAKFDQTVKRLHDIGCTVCVWIDAEAIALETDLWQTGEAENYTLRDENGYIRKTYGAGRWEAWMCIGTQYWKDKLREFVLTLVSHDVDMIFLDRFPWVLDGTGCYDHKHGHPLGSGGNWEFQEWTEALAEIHRSARLVNPDIVFGGEGFAEVFLPYMDLGMTRDLYVEKGEETPFCFESQAARNGTLEVIPLFSYVYHEFLVAFANFCPGPEPLYGEYTTFAFSRPLTSGEMLMWEGYGNPEDTPFIDLASFDYARKMAFARETYARDFLVFGKMNKTAEIECPNASISHCEWRESYGGWLNFTLMRPAVQHEAWFSLEGTLGLIFTNIDRYNNATSGVTLDPLAYGMPNQNFVFLVRDGVYYSIGPVSGVVNASFEMKPREIMLLVLVPGTEAKCDLCLSVDGLPHSGSSVYVNRSFINVTMWNNGPMTTRVFNVSVLAYWKHLNTTEVLNKETVSNLDPGSNLTLQIPFETLNKGDFKLTVVADSDNSAAELNEMNNEVSVAVKAEIWGAGDLNGDGTVDIYDAITLANAYNSIPGSPNWNANADINSDDIVDIYDAILLANNYGKTA